MKNYKIVDKSRFCLFILTLLLVSYLMISFIFTNLSLGNYDDTSYKTYYYVVNNSDTLWDISEQYKPDNMSTRQFIKLIKEYNKFIEGSSINVGEHLNIPLINK